ncbi:uncharacterized protein LOC105255530 [Camponotus floridanus]|uniref:uncharacterized protein LOC105255530 n=1 Tax=Camponotus floridanus TaxID=104421 RepID=UPI000DC69956|nr:uncharacterized protein LOC105255530 [Camponotus floridanus]
MLQKAFGDHALSERNVYKWYKHFKEGRESVEDEERSGRPSTSTDEQHVKKIEELVLANRRMTVRDLADAVGISKGSANTILKDILGLKRVKSRLVPKNLNFFEKERRINICKEMLSDYQSVMKRIITGDETWIYAYDPKTTDQSSEYRAKGEAKPKRSRQSRSKIKIMLTAFIDYRGVVHSEFLPPGQTVNKEYYLSVMRRLREAIRKKRPELWANNSWFLHHDNAPSHTALVLRDFFAKNSIHIVPQPPYSPDLAPCDFWLFPKLKRPLRGNRFETIEEIQRESLRALKAIPEGDFNSCFEDWKIRWHKCIVSGGDYFEGDEIDLEE